MLANWLLDTPLIVVPSMSQEEIDHEWDRAYLRSRMTQMFLDHQIDVETYFDFMAEQGYEPTELLGAAEENLEFAIAHSIPIEL